MVNEIEIWDRIYEVNRKIDALVEERSRLQMVVSGLIVTDAEKTEQVKKADEAKVAFEVIGKDVIVEDATPAVAETTAILEGEN
jgi:hypothetical protein